MCAVRTGEVEVELQPGTPCAGCKGLCLWTLNRRRTRLTLRRDTGTLKPGDALSLSVPGRALLQAALLAYGLPLLAMLAGALLLGLSGSDGRAVLGAGLGLLIGLPLGRRLQHGVLGKLALQAAPGNRPS